MSGEIPSLVDLQNTKVRIDHFAELIDGTPSGTSTNPVTGVTHPTYEKAIKDLGFKPASFNFVTGGTLGVTDADKCIYNPVPTGDDNWYSWSGNLPHDVAPATDPTLPGSGYVPRTDVLLRNQLSESSGSAIVGFGESTVYDTISSILKSTAKTKINISAFGSTGTISVGSNEAWNAATAFARSIAPSYTNNIGQSWPDLSGFEFVSDSPIYPSEQLGFRHIFGATFNVNIVAPDNFSSPNGYILDSTVANSSDNALNRRPNFIKFIGSINCRYKCNAIYLNDFLGFYLGGNVFNYLSWGVMTGTSGNEFVLLPNATISQWTYTANGEADVPASVTSGTGVYVNCGDCVILGIVAYYKTRGLRINGRSCFIGSGAHIYGDRKQALLQESGGGNLLIDGAWFDASMVELVAEAQVRNSRFFLSSGDSLIGIIINGGNEVSVKGCTFLGISSGTTAIYRDSAAKANTSCVTSGNEYWDGIANCDVHSATPTIIGASSTGAGTYTRQSGYWYRDGDFVEFYLSIAWSGHTGTGELVITGLPNVTFGSVDIPCYVIVNSASLTSVTSAYVKANGTGVRLKSGSSAVSMVASGDIVVSGRYRVR